MKPEVDRHRAQPGVPRREQHQQELGTVAHRKRDARTGS